MKAHALPRPAWPWLHGHRQAAAWLRFVTDRFLWLPLGAAIALVWANTAAESYFRLAHTLAFPVNEIGMAVFLGLITQEAIEAVMPGGALAHVAALGDADRGCRRWTAGLGLRLSRLHLVETRSRSWRRRGRSRARSTWRPATTC